MRAVDTPLPAAAAGAAPADGSLGYCIYHGGLRQGQQVRVDNLAKHAKLNGMTGKLNKYDIGLERWQLHIECHGTVKIQPVNLLPIESKICNIPALSAL